MRAMTRRRRTMLQSAVILALYGSADLVLAEEPNSTTLQEVVVTATSRPQDIIEVPFSIAVIKGDDLKAAAVTDLLTLARAVPSLSLVDLGDRYATAEVPTIRGINASNIAQGSQLLSQSPVGVYLGNSPIDGVIDLTDINRVEVLRGPQGTLYGAGALGGAIRIVPNAPEMGIWDGSISTNVASVAHGSQPSYGLEGYANIPVARSLALRVSGKYAYDAGFIDAFGFEQRVGGPLSAPVLADPSNPVTSPAVFGAARNGWNDEKKYAGRADLLWQEDKAHVDLAYIHGHIEGTGGPQDNTYWTGGPYPIDPRVSLPAGGDYRYFSAGDQPFRRDTSLTSLDASYDVGFATMSSISSYYSTHGETTDDETYQVFIFEPFTAYYTGNPINPRFVSPGFFSHSDRNFSQELRLVSHPAEETKVDYVAGAFFQNRRREANFFTSAPGTDSYSISQGCTAPFSLGAAFPNCLVTLGPTAAFFDASVQQQLKNESVYGELTVHAAPQVQVTLGARYYREDFTAGQQQFAYALGNTNLGDPTESKTSGALFKINPSFEYLKNQSVYATFSQGYRPGGANSFPVTGPLAESAALLRYSADKTNNFEVGVKGRSAGNLSYSLALFDVDWKNPQIGGYTPNTSTAVVYNGLKARSTGFDAEITGPILLPGLKFSASASYAHARLTEDFGLPANDGAGGISPNVITGSAGARLPGSAERSAAATLDYHRAAFDDWSTTLTANVTYTGSVLNSLPAAGSNEQPLGGYTLGNLSASLERSRYGITLYVYNVTDKRAVLSYLKPGDVQVVGGLAEYNVINRPREIGLRFTFTGM